MLQLRLKVHIPTLLVMVYGMASLASSLTTSTDAANLLAQVSSYELSGTISSTSELANHIKLQSSSKRFWCNCYY